VDLDTLRGRIETALTGRHRRVVQPEGLVPAAVLLLLLNRGEPHILFTKRTELVAHHKGQFSFPGGIVETRDSSRLETALREAREEIGLPSEVVEILGALDDTETVATPFVITPFIGLIREPVSYTPDGKEIEKVVEVPLAALLDPTHFREEQWERNGALRPVYFYEHGGDVIWGATARILKQFLDLVFPGETAK
jgi:8-oxo-dGTP pyrophosphatase MutT (NUDIX family)